MKMRVLGLMLTLVLATALGLAACGEDKAAPQAVPERPVVRLEVGDRTYQESVYSYCWPEAPDNLECDVDAVALVQPVENVPVAPGSAVKIVVAPGAGEPTPTSLTATLLGFEQTQDYGAAAEGVFPVPGEDDLYRVRVDVTYGDVEGYEAYVSYVFGLDVSAEIAAAPTAAVAPGADAETPAATEIPPAAETETPFMTATFVPTSAPPPTDAVEPTEAATEETAGPEATASAEATEAAGLIPGGETAAATEIVGVAGATLAADTPAAETPSAEATEPATEAPPVAETPTPAPTEPPAPTVAPSETPAPTETPQPTETPVPTEPATEPPAPTETPQPTATLIPTEPPTAAPAASATPAPAAAPGTEPAPGEGPGPTPAPAELGTIALSGVVRLHTAGITVPVVGAEVSYRQISAVSADRNSRGELYTEAGGRFAFPLIALNAADTIELTASAPGFQPQTVTRHGADVAQADGRFELVLEPLRAEPRITPRITADEAPAGGDTAAAPPAPAGPTTLPAAPEDVPPLTLVVAGQAYAPVGYQRCELTESGEPICFELPAPAAATQRVPLPRGATAQILIEGERPQTLTVEYVSDSGAPLVPPESVAGDNIVLLVIAPEPGSYILALHVAWAESEASYYFRVLVEG